MKPKGATRKLSPQRRNQGQDPKVKFNSPNIQSFDQKPAKLNLERCQTPGPRIGASGFDRTGDKLPLHATKPKEKKPNQPIMKKITIETNQPTIEFAEIRTTRGGKVKIWEGDANIQQNARENKPEERKRDVRSPYRKPELTQNKSPRITSPKNLIRTVSAKKITFIQDEEDILASCGTTKVIRSEAQACFLHSTNNLHKNIITFFAQMLYRMRETEKQKISMHIFPVNTLGLYTDPPTKIIDRSIEKFIGEHSILLPSYLRRLIFIDTDSKGKVTLVVTQTDRKQHLVISMNQVETAVSIEKTMAKVNNYLAEELVRRGTILAKQHAFDVLQTHKLPDCVINYNLGLRATSLTVRVCFLLLKLTTSKYIDTLSNSDSELEQLKYFNDIFSMMFFCQEARNGLNFTQKHSGAILEMHRNHCKEAEKFSKIKIL